MVLIISFLFQAVFASRLINTAESLNLIDFSTADVNSGFTLELCAGIVDKTKSLKEIVKEEILEECGYDVPLSKISELVTVK